jgi:hypothetical protein
LAEYVNDLLLVVRGHVLVSRLVFQKRLDPAASAYDPAAELLLF